MIRNLLIAACFFLLAIPCAQAAEEAPAGSVRTLKGACQIQRGGTILPAAVGMPVYPLDILTTSGDSALGIILYDDTTISLGPDSSLVLKEYVFEPHASRFAAAFGFVKGSFAYLSGIIARLAPESLRLETPSATIAVRGTRLLIKVD
jgi:hypothetical protein